MELTFVKNICQLQLAWLHPCKVCDQVRSVGKITFTRNSKSVGVGRLPPPPPPRKKNHFEIKDAKRRILTLFEAMFWMLVW